MGRLRWPCLLGTAWLAFALVLDACTQGSARVVETPEILSPVPQATLPLTSDVPAVTIRFACYSFWQPEFEKLAADFHAQNPDVRVEFVTLSPAFVGQVGAEAMATYYASLEYTDVPLPTTSKGAIQLRWLYQALADILRGAKPEVALAEAQQQATK